MSASEFLIIVAVVIVGLVFIIAAQKFIFSSSKETEEYKYKAEGESLVSLLDRITKETADYVSFNQYMNLCNISVKGGVLTYERNGVEVSFHVSKEVKDVSMKDVSSICVMKSDEVVTINEKCTCNFDSKCSPDECKEPCPDCSGPKNICIGDGFCNKNILESCVNSIDCKCDSRVCCPDSPDADNSGCSVIETLKKKGEECWCNSQCESGLQCNPTKEIFTEYKNACCSEKTKWDGNDCVEPCKKIYKLVVAANRAPSMSEYKTRAEGEVKMFLKESPWRECPECIEIQITDINCQNSFNDAGGLTACVNNQVKDYNMIHIVDYNGICNGYCTGIGGRFTICSNNLPSGISDSCFSHELGHCMGHLCDEYGYGTWTGQGCSASDWPGAINAKSSSGCKVFNCAMNDACCGAKLKPDESSDNTVDIMGGGGGIISCNKNGGMYTAPIHFRDWTYERFKNSIPLNNYCG